MKGVTLRSLSISRPRAQTLAAVDLGSNSFHMIVARAVNGELKVMDRLQEMVRLAAGLDTRNRLSKDAKRRALACLRRFGQRLRGMHADSVRVVGTNTLRQAHHAGKFLARAQEALGHPIEIIAGREEARLIYAGVSHGLPDSDPRLVVDIGGGSTELIRGQGHAPAAMESLTMGCVGFSQAYFADGEIRRKSMKRAETAAGLELQPVAAQFRDGWREVVGSSGTIQTVAAVVRAAGWSEDGITRESLVRLRAALLNAGHVERLALPGLNPERAPVFPGGVAILSAVFEALGIEHMKVAEGALREGLLYDLMGRVRQADVRAQTIRVLSERYHVDAAQAARVARTAQYCFGQAATSWKLTDADAALLDWAARLHEIGLAIAHAQYHKHGAYLARHSDLAGFSHTEQESLAFLIRTHRRTLLIKEFETLPREQAKRARHLAMLLRLSVLLHRSRADAVLPPFQLAAGRKSIEITFPRGWLKRHPLTAADLAQEREYLSPAGMTLRPR
jgi:exopolyphosphatase/guanosine-5'-triphosphate,3'-diphosphate pyrophosphatase